MSDNPTITSDEQAQAKSSDIRVRSLKELIERISGRGANAPAQMGDSGRVDIMPFPYLALVGQLEMKYALLLSLVNPAIGGVLLIGPRGTGKTTAVRSLVNLLPQVPRSLCYYGCMPEDVEAGGVDAVCQDCARKYGLGEPLAGLDDVRLVELPLNAEIDNIVGWIEEGRKQPERMHIRRGILAHADRNLIYIDEVNLLSDEVVDIILDAAAQGVYTIQRGSLIATYRSRFVLIGSMNPEEGRLRPQIMDRFGLRVVVRGLGDIDERLEAYKRVRSFQDNPRIFVMRYQDETDIAKLEIQEARDRLSQVVIPDSIAQLGLAMIRQMNIDTLRAEITLFEASRALAAIDNRLEVVSDDLRIVAPMALRMRSSEFIENYLKDQAREEERLKGIIDSVMPHPPMKEKEK